MNVKSKTYMQSSEFKERQGSFAFFVAKAFEYLVNFKDECVAGWRELFKKTARFENRTLALPFGKMTHREWQEQTTQVYLKLVNG